jgi:protein-S-isoprenylcysteine O-methyltransferase Ste14
MGWVSPAGRDGVGDAPPAEEEAVMSPVKLAVQTLLTILAMVIGMGAQLFLPAWTLDYWQAWVFIVLVVGCSNAIGVYLALKDPALLARRRQAGPTAEKRPAQRIAQTFLILSVAGVLVLSALDHRFVWSPPVPTLVSLAGDLLVALGFLLVFRVLRANSYAASTVEVSEGQQLNSTGPYGIVRHPMYTGALLMGAGTPLALGSWWGLLLIVLAAPAYLIVRILDEEMLLKSDLPGYTEYMRRVRYRLVPHVW